MLKGREDSRIGGGLRMGMLDCYLGGDVNGVDGAFPSLPSGREG